MHQIRPIDKSASMRLKLPQRIVKDLRLDAYDVIEWDSYTDENGITFAKIRKLG